MPIPKTPLNEPRLSAKEKVYNALLEWITDGTLRPGEKISDIEIAGYFSVSRTPVREAIQMLADQKLVDIFPGKESRISEVNMDVAISNYLLMGNLNAVALDMCYEFIDESVIEYLESVNDEMSHAIENGDIVLTRKADRKFHDRIFELRNNYFLTTFYNTLYTHCLRIENLYFSQTAYSKDSVKQHIEIIDALKSNDIMRAKDALIYNWTSTVEDK